MDSAADPPCRRGLPHSEILGSKPARGSPRLFAACHVLHRLLAPRHPPDALAFLGPHQRQPHHNPTRSTTRRGPRPSAHSADEEKTDAAAAAGNDSSVNCKLQVLADRWPKPTSGKHTHAKRAPCRRRKQEGRTTLTCRRPPHHDACKNRSSHARTTGTSSPPHDVQGTCAAAPAQQGRRRADGVLASGGRARPGPRRPHLPGRGSEAWWAWADLNGRPHAYQACALTS